MTSTRRRAVRDEEWLLLPVAGGGGILWGVFSLVLGSSWSVAHAAGVVRAALTVLALPLHAAYWLGSTLGLSATDPSGLVIAIGMLLGLVPGVIGLGVLRWRDRW